MQCCTQRSLQRVQTGKVVSKISLFLLYKMSKKQPPKETTEIQSNPNGDCTNKDWEVAKIEALRNL
jgi:hypothetical protein